MESRVYKGPPDWEGYGTLKCTDLIYATTEGIGGGFLLGGGLGFVYNFVKANNNISCGFKSRVCNALVKAPCIAGNLALFTLGHNLGRIAYFKYTGRTPHGDTIPYEIHATAVGGAVGFAHYGLRRASIAAFTSAGLAAFFLFYDLYMNRLNSSICKTNTYSYPYYRPLLHHPDEDYHILPPQAALLYDSKFPEDYN